MSATPPIPPAVWMRLRQFLEDRRPGAVTLNVHQGTITSATLTERVRTDET